MSIKKNITAFNRKESELISLRKASKMSKGELIIAEFLKNEGIDFYREFYFKELSVSGKVKLLFFDFYIPLYNMVIEFDGVQHYTGKYNGKTIVNGNRNDFYKTAFCKKTGLNLLRIKYSSINEIEKIICDFVDKYY